MECAWLLWAHGSPPPSSTGWSRASSLSGQTLGKRLVGIKVVDAEGRPPGYARAAIREVVGKLLSALLLYLGYLVALFHPERRALHDLVGGTWVVAVRRGESPVKAEEG